MSNAEQLKHANAREAVLARIRSGYYRPGQRLPSERELATDLELSHITVRRGLEDLVEAGVIVKKPRVGNFVQQIRPIELAHRVAIVLPKHMHSSLQSHPIPALLLQGIVGELDQRDCSVSLISYDYPQFWLDAGEAMLARGVTGALVWAASDTPYDQVRKLRESGIKVVLLNGGKLWPDLGFSSVSIDFEGVMRESVQHLAELGHRRLTWISYAETRYRSLEEQLIAECARQVDLDRPEEAILRITDARSGSAAITKLLSQANRPTGLIVADEFIAHEVFRACRRLKLDVPEDVSIVAIADALPQSHVVPLSAPATPSLWVDAARRAAHHLRQLLASGDSKQIEVFLQAPIHWRESVAPPAAGR